MCGSTDAQNQLQQEQLDAYKEANDLMEKQYANQQEIYAPMAAQFQSILAKGPNQQGMSAEERQNLNATVSENTARNYKQAAEATAEGIAGLGGGTNPLPTGSEAALKAGVASSAAQEKSSEQGQIVRADYAEGRDQWLKAAQGLEGIATGQNPLGYESNATSAGSAAGTTANQIASQNNSWVNAALGAVGAVGGGWASGGFKFAG